MSEENIKNILNHLTNLYKSYERLNDEGMQETAKRYEELKNAIESSINGGDINSLIDFAEKTYKKIDWKREESDREISIENNDYRLILIHLLNVFIANKKEVKITDFKSTKEEFGRIVKIIKSFGRQ